jgi:hypothetical protein
MSTAGLSQSSPTPPWPQRPPTANSVPVGSPPVSSPNVGPNMNPAQMNPGISPPSQNPAQNPVISADRFTVSAPVSPTVVTMDQLQRRQTTPIVRLNWKQKMLLMAEHPLLFTKMKKLDQAAASQEEIYNDLYMYNKVYKSLNLINRYFFQHLLEKGILQNVKAEDGRSTLYHLYAMLTTRRAPGYQPAELVNETVNILADPEAITQKFGPLTPPTAKKILMTRNQPDLSLMGVAPPSKMLTAQDLEVESSGTCVSSSLMWYMADKEPAELARHLNELTSPMNAFFEKVKLHEISPDNPQAALNTLRENKTSFILTGPDEALVKVNLPPAGVLRAIDSQFAPTDRSYRNAVEAAYQSALTFLADHTYDPATDKIDDAGPEGEGHKGLTEMQKSVMETIIKENGGVQSVTYQAVDSKANPATPEEENNSYLYGYNRSFEQTQKDIERSLQMKEPVIIGTTDTDENGAVVMGHEITIMAQYYSPQTHELIYGVADSDDDNPKLVARRARDIIPSIHHIGFPLALAKEINQEISTNQGILTPDAQDAAHYTLLHQQTGPVPSMMEQQTGAQQVLEQQTAAQPTNQPQNPFQVAPVAAQPSSPAAPIQAVPVAPPMRTGNPAAVNNPWLQNRPLISA